MEVLQKLDEELVGLKSVKTRIREIAALLLVERMRRTFGLTTRPPTLHMSFTGQPGTGRGTSREHSHKWDRSVSVNSPLRVACRYRRAAGKVLNCRCWSRTAYQKRAKVCAM